MADTEELRIPEIAGLLRSWWAGDELPELSPLLGLAVDVAPDSKVMAAATGNPVTGLERHRGAAHRPYLACLCGLAVAYGWPATVSASFGSRRTMFLMPPGRRLFWGFVILPEWRRRGIYPRLLQTILHHETVDASRVWTFHHIDTDASRRSMRMAGICLSGEILRPSDGAFAVSPANGSERTDSGAQVFNFLLDGAGNMRGV